MFIKPRNSGVKVPDPVRKDFLPEEGREVESSPYWHRRIVARDVDVVLPKPPKKGE